MKTLLFLLSITISTASFSQYQSLLNDTTRIWNVFNSSDAVTIYDIIDTLFLGDEINYNNRKYRELYRSSFNGSLLQKLGYLSEDTITGKVWLRLDTSSAFQNFIVYDLSLNQGDTLNYGNGIYDPSFVVDTAYIKNGRKYIKLHIIPPNSYLLAFTTHYQYMSYDTLLFIEGVGTSRAFFIDYHPLPYSISRGTYYLVCASQNNQSIYQIDFNLFNPIKSCDSLLIGIYSSTNEINLSSSVKIFPNPTSEIINISANEPISSIEIINMKGKRLNKQLIDKNETKIVLPDKGIYLLKIQLENGLVLTKKVLRL